LKEFWVSTQTEKFDSLFDDSLKVLEMCRTCKRYGTKATCPPYIEKDYKYILKQFRICLCMYEKFTCKNLDDWEIIGKESSLVIHDAVKSKVHQLREEGYYFVVGFGAGSCKLCSTCSFPCSRPDESLIPLEATGVNVCKLMEIVGVKLKFPVKNEFYRIGAVFYD